MSSGLAAGLNSRLQSAKQFVLGRTEPEPQGWLSVFNFLSNEKSYMYAGIAFAIGAFFGFLSFVLLGMIMVAPDKFVLCFTLAMVCLLVGLANLSGPRLYCKKLFQSKNLIATSCLIVSIILSVYFSMISKSGLLSLIFCIVQLNAILYFFCRTSAINL